MSDASDLFREYCIRYASEVNLDRSISYLEDGLKPVQRRILHVLFKIDDGRMHKVAGVSGDVLHYHPHGEGSVNEALVNLSNSRYFIEQQGNFGNLLTGDSAAAARYIECRIMPFAKKIFYSPEITQYTESYDGRNKEPVVFPAKLPVVLLIGTNGLGYSMRTYILPHNANEVIEAMKRAINKEEFALYPDFQTGGIVDVSEYNDGTGSIRVRAKIHTDEDSRKIIIDEIPYTTTTESLIESIGNAARSGKIKIASIDDFTTETARIELTLARGANLEDEIKSLWAFTDAEKKISGLNPLVVENQTHPMVMTISQIIKYHSKRLIDILNAELDIESSELNEKLHSRTLDRIFIEQRVYKKIEELKSQEEIKKAIIEGMEPFRNEFVRDLNDSDIDRLLQLPIRRISLFDIEKNSKEIQEINAAIKKCAYNKSHINKYAISVLDDIRSSLPSGCERKTEIQQFEVIEKKAISKRDLTLKYDQTSGHLGYDIKSGEELLKISEYDKVLIIKNNGDYIVLQAPDKYYIGKERILYCGYTDKEYTKDVIFTIIFEEKTTKQLFIKRCKITSFHMNKVYSILPPGGDYKIKKFSTEPNMEIEFIFKSSRGGNNKKYFAEFAVHNASSKGQVLMRREIEKFNLKKCDPSLGAKPASEEGEDDGELFDVSDLT